MALAAASLGAVLALPAAAQQTPLPQQRIDLVADTDMPGGDLGPIFDTTLQACVNACLNLDGCQAMTYNATSRACFPKGPDAGAPGPFANALSGRVIRTPPERLAMAQTRIKAAEGFLDPDDLRRARDLAVSAVSTYLPTPDPDPAAAAAKAAEMGDHQTAIRMSGLLVAQRDLAQDWLYLGQLTRNANISSNGEINDWSVARMIAAVAANSYLRAESDRIAADALSLLAFADEQISRGPDSLRALRLAASLAPDDDAIAAALQRAQDRHGMRVTDSGSVVESATPRYCITMSHRLDSRVDYADFLRLPDHDMAVSASGNQLCVTGLSFGQQLQITLRAGLPAADGERLARDTTLRSYIRDRTPAVRFPGRAYVLPSGGDRGLGVVTVNADALDLTLLRLSDRNLLRVMSEGMFATPLDSWRAEYFSDRMAAEVWRGTADIAPPPGSDSRNREITTRLPIAHDIGDLTPGIYILQASVSGQQDDDQGVAAQWFVISDMGVSSYSGSDGLAVVVRSLASTGPVAGAEVALISRANEVLARETTDADGVARFAPGLTRGREGATPALITTAIWQGEGADRQLRDMAFLSLNEPEFDLSDRGVEGQAPAPALDIFATTDRGAYRVGDTVNATVLARNSAIEGLDGLPLGAHMIRPDGVEQARSPLTATGGGGYVLSWTLPANAPRGSWRLEVRAEADGPALASTRLLVEDFLPERIDFTPRLGTADQPQDQPATARAGDVLALSLDARWLFGAPAADLPVEGNLWMAPRRGLPQFPGYLFGRHDDDSQPESITLPGGQTDAQGHFATTITLPDNETSDPRPFDARLVLDIREGAGRPVERDVTQLVMPADPVIGIKPAFQGDSLPESSEARFDIIALGPDLTPQPMPADWTLNRIETRYEWYSLDGQWQWEPVTDRRRLTGGTVDLGHEPATVAAQVDWGSYELVVTAVDGSASSALFHAGWGVASSATDAPDRLTVALDKPAYRSGDVARLNVSAVADGTGIVSVLAGQVVSLQMIPLVAGENEIDLPVTDEWGAGVYVTVSALRPIDNIQPGDRMPVRALGLAHAAVDPGARALQASLDLPDEINPRGMVPVTLNVAGAAPGQTVHATIAAVDQGILNLTRFAPPDPSAHYFGQRRLGVGLRDLYGRLILPSGAPDGTLRQGGDAQTGQMMAPPPTEELMSWFSGPLTLDADGQVQVDLPVGDFNGEIRVMAVVWSDGAVGQADGTILSRDPVVATITAPAFLAPGDRAEIGLRLTHATGPEGEIGLSVAQTGGPADVDVTLPQDHVTLAAKSEAKLAIPITAQGASGPVALRLTLTTPDGHELTKDIALMVALNEPLIQRHDRLTIAAGASMTPPPALTQGMVAGADLSMAVGNYGRLDVAGALARLQRYPYGCTEQLASVAMPLLYLPRLAMLEDVPAGDPAPVSQSRPDALEQAIAQILTRQNASGSFGMWDASGGDLWLDAYVTDFLSRARSLGHEVPDPAFRQAIDNLRNRVNYATDPQSADAQENAALAYAAAVLARERAAVIGDLRYYADTAPEAFKTAMSAANLGSALAAYGDQARADRMFGQARDILRAATDDAPAWRSDYGTDLRDRAAVLALASNARSQVIDLDALTGDVAQRIALQQESGSYRSTQELVWSVLAAESLSHETGALTLNGVALSSPVTSLPQDATLANPGTADVDVTLTATGQPADPPRAGGKGYQIQRDYYGLDGQWVDPAQVQLGTRMVAVLTIRPDSAEGGRLMVTDPLPAGFEIDNPNLLQAGDIAALDWLDVETNTDMAEFRADRFAASLGYGGTDAFRLAYLLRAVTPGQFRHPAASVENMYRPEFRAWTDGGQVVIR